MYFPFVRLRDLAWVLARDPYIWCAVVAFGIGAFDAFHRDIFHFLVLMIAGMAFIALRSKS